MPEIEVRRSDIHGTGVFAKEDIQQGTRIIEYLGEKVSTDEGQRRQEAQSASDSIFFFELDEETYLDGDVPGNDARFTNHSCDPNCESEVESGQIWIVALKAIQKGEELTFDYGFDAEFLGEYPCRCAAKNCVGYIIGKEHRDNILLPRAE
jgi:hypothetical protein